MPAAKSKTTKQLNALLKKADEYYFEQLYASAAKYYKLALSNGAEFDGHDHSRLGNSLHDIGEYA